jgi:hypothetical protein
LIESFESFDKNETFAGVQSLHEMFSYFDEMGSYCYWAVKNELTPAHFTALFAEWW